MPPSCLPDFANTRKTFFFLYPGIPFMAFIIMAAVEVTISGVLYDKTARTTQPVVLIGEASLTGLGVGGGPIIPPEQPGQPPGTPVFPIWGPPGFNPPGPGYPPGI